MTTRALPRYHGLDAVRAAMMLLGLVLHSAASYITLPLQVWLYRDPNTSGVFSIIFFVIHLFRMPVFFVAAGFFAAMVMGREGPSGFLRNRTRRVLLPLVLFWPVVYTAAAAAFAFANGRLAGDIDMTPITSGAFLGRASLAHFWFLWDLMIFYVVAVALMPIAARLPERWHAAMDAAFRAVATTAIGAVTLSAVSTLTLLPMRSASLETSLALLPPIRVLAAYGVFFTFGWFLYRRRDVLDELGRNWKLPLLLGVLTSVAYTVVYIGRPIADPRLAHVVGCVLAALSMWMLIFGMVGAFLTLSARPNPVVRYLSDGSYWMYIIHLPFAAGVPGLLGPYSLPAGVKFALTLTVVSAVSLVSYHYLVRSTALGVLLNGRRYPRALPKAQPAGQIVAV
jgi:peptidoglycan/LPS O-acetylase OafA/YrhL